MDGALLALLDRLARFGEDNDARETARPRRMLNITRDTGRLLWILVVASGARRILEVGTSNAFSTIWLADAALPRLPGPVDLVFLDADRPSYLTYLELVVPKLGAGGLLVADNVTSHASELQDYLARVKSHPRLFSVTVPIGNGEEIAVKLDDGA